MARTFTGVRQLATALSTQRHIATYAIPSSSPAFLDMARREHGAAMFGGASLRSCTAAVATRLIKQEEVPLMAGTPTTLAAAMQEPCDQARVITTAEAPHRIVFANRAWEQLCGYSASEVQGRTGLSFLQGPHTDPHCISKVSAAVKQTTRARVAVINYKADGSPFLNRLQISPLWSQRPGEYTHLLGVLQEVPAQ